MHPKSFPELHPWAAWTTILLLLTAIAPLRTEGRLAGSEFVFRSWSMEAGLPQNSVNAIAQTPDGYLWLATQGGLARFDGVRFRVFGLADGLPAITVNCLLVDTRGQLWIGTGGGGLCRWRDGQIEPFDDSDGALGDIISALAEDAKGRLWVGTPTGVSVWRDGRPVETDVSGLDDSRIRALLAARDGTMWISAVQGLFTFAGERLSECDGPPDFPHPSPYCLLEDSMGRLWASIGNGRVLCRQDGEWHVYDQQSGLPFAYVTTLAEDSDGVVWAGSLDAGLFGFRDERFFPVTTADGLSDDAIRSLLADAEGHLWVGTRTSGLNRMARRKLRLYGAPQGLTHDYTRSVAEAPDGTLWVGTLGGGLYQETPEGFQPRADAQTVMFPFVSSLLVARDGSLWMGGAGSLFQWRDGRRVAGFTRAQEPWLADQTVTALCQDNRDGLWIGNTGGQLIRYRNGDFKVISQEVARGVITALAVAEDGSVWIGSTAGGASHYNPETGEVVSLAETMSARDIRSLHLDAEGTLWIGTGGGGLGRWKAGRLAWFTTQQGLGDNTVSQILEDDDGHLWLGCNRGIFRVRKSELDALADGRVAWLHPRAYGVGDGMWVEECASGVSPTALRTSAGLLVFPTVRGLVLIDPQQQTTAIQPPRVFIEELVVGGRVQAVPTTSASAPESRPKVVGATDRRDVEFHYTGLSFAAPERIRFRYQLEGLDAEWIEAGTRRAAYYQHLPPGEFVFRVLAANADHVWTETAAALTVIVQPHFWETRWFMITLGVLLLGSAGGVTRLVERRRYHRRLAALEVQHAVERERLRISRDMHDHVGSMLTQVSQLSDLAQDQADATAASERLACVGAKARSAVQALDEIVWATNPRNDNLARFADYASRFADEFFESTGIRCWQEIATDLPNRPLPADVRHNIFLALKEALANVLKHARATEVWLRVRTDEDQTIGIEVEDNGCGFTPGVSATRAGNGLRNVEARLTEERGTVEVTSAPGRGTKVRLAFPAPKIEEY